MGAVAGGHCYADAVAAAQSECAAYPRAGVDGGQLVTWSCQGVASDGSSLDLVKTDTAGGVTSQALTVSYAPCDEMSDYNDALAVWGLGLAAVAAVWCVKTFVYRLVANQ